MCFLMKIHRATLERSVSKEKIIDLFLRLSLMCPRLTLPCVREDELELLTLLILLLKAWDYRQLPSSLVFLAIEAESQQEANLEQEIQGQGHLPSLGPLE